MTGTPRAVAVLTGPTGAGKTDFALALARDFPIEIVSVDSAQVYRGLDIGSAKPSGAIRAQVPHHLIDLVEPSASYSAGQFVRDATRAIEDIEARGRVPLLVGGTMLYIRALTGGIAELPGASGEIGPRCTSVSKAPTRRLPRVSIPMTRSASSARWRYTWPPASGFRRCKQGPEPRCNAILPSSR
jgi:tRNA dimethylallyltransferase